MAFETIDYDRRGPIGVITLNRPQVLNAMNKQLLDDLDAALDQIEKTTTCVWSFCTAPGAPSAPAST